MKKILLILCVLTALTASAVAPAMDGETLRYRVMFKWGLVNKQAGHVTLTTRNIGNGQFHSQLAAATEKWADKIYKVRDTLVGNMSVLTCEPTLYEKITHEDGDFKHDRIDYTRTGSKVVGHCIRIEQKKKAKELTRKELTLESEGLTLDMLSSFYYMRSIDFPKMRPGETVQMTVFSGKRKELLSITYHGMETIDVGKNRYPSFHITFKFTGDGGKKTSDDMDAWISTEPSRVPLRLEGKLAVGKVQCFLVE